MPESSNHSFGSPVPVFRVKNVDASIAYYLNALGFELRWRAGDSFACVARDKCSIFLTSDHQSQARMWVWIGVEDVRALHVNVWCPAQRSGTRPRISSGRSRCRSKTSTGTFCASGLTPRRTSRSAHFADADGVRWRHLGNQKYERVD